MKAGEIIRIIVFSVLGFLLMFYIQPMIYQNRMIRISDVPLNTWLGDNYTAGALLVFGVSVIATVLWYILAATAKVRGANDVFRWQVVWWMLGLLPLLGIFIALLFFNESDDARLSLAGFFIFNGIFLLYWLPTATSSPGLLKHIPPGAFLLRRLIGS
ncbi:MAG: hypothetical protein AB4426_31350 [Xenococcaceae cyanobacterium]